MRTDSVTLSKQAFDLAVKQVQTDFGEDYLADRVRNGYSGTAAETTADAEGEAGEGAGGKAAKKAEKTAAGSGSGSGSGEEQALFAQEAHEAIRPAVNAELGRWLGLRNSTSRTQHEMSPTPN